MRIVPVFISVAILLPYVIPPAFALPDGKQVESGKVSFESPDPSTLNIVAEDKAVINFNSFNIDGGETVNFIQPSGTASVLSRVVGNTPTQIFGSLFANGILIFTNPHGIHFAPSANVQVNTLIASTLEISTNNFIKGNYIFEHRQGAPFSQILNEGSIAGNAIALIASAVQNTGLIQAHAGIVHLASGDKTTVSFDARGLIQVEVNEATSGKVYDLHGTSVKDAVANSGTIEAAQVVMTAQTAKDIFKTAVNQSGIVRANQITQDGGLIRIVASGKVQVSGTLEAAGGNIEISAGDDVSVDSSLTLTGNASITTPGAIRTNADITASGNLLMNGSSVAGPGTIKAGYLKMTGDTFLINSLSATTHIVKNIGGIFISELHKTDSLITIEGDGFGKVTYLSANNLTLESGDIVATSPGIILQGNNVSVIANYFGSTSAPLNIDAATTTIRRTSGEINILQSTGIGTSVLITGPPGGFGAILYSHNTNLVLEAGRVTLSDPAQSIYFYGTITFYNFECTTPAQKIYFEAGHTYTFKGNLRIEGAVGGYNVVYLESSQKGSPWYINIESAQYTLAKVAIGDSYNINDSIIYASPSSTLGNNEGWRLNTVYWVGGSSNLWSDAGNWSGGVPQGNAVQFDTAHSLNSISIVDTAYTGANSLSSMSITNWTGSISLKANLNVTGAYSQQSGTFNESQPFDGTSTDQNTYHLTSGSFTLGGTGVFRGSKNSTQPAYRIADARELKLVYTLPARNYVQTAAITLSGDFTSYMIALTGSYNGNGYTISNLSITATADYAGLFSTNSGSISNVGLVSGSVNGGDGHSYIGGLVGTNSGTISHCYNANNVTGYYYVGGLVGENYGSISNSYNTGHIQYIGDSCYLGGLVGDSNGGSITNCYNAGGIGGDYYVGGLVGSNWNGASITNSYNSGAVNGQWMVGGIAGWWNRGSMTNCYNVGSVSDNTHSAAGLVSTIYAGSVTNCGWWTGSASQAFSSNSAGVTVTYNESDATVFYNPTHGVYSTWDFTATSLWSAYSGSDPHLQSEKYGTPLTLFGWAGSSSSNWSAIANWTTLQVPDATSIVIIPSGTTYSPTLDIDASFKDIRIDPSATVSFSSKNVAVNGSFTNFGSFTSTGTFTFGGSAAQLLTTGGADATHSFGSITHTGAGNLVLAGNLLLSGTLTQNNGSSDIDPSASNYSITAAGLTLSAGTINTNSRIGTWTINGNVAINSGTLKAPTTINVSGNWSNAGTFTPGSSTVAFKGSSGTQTITSGGTGAGKPFYNIEINNTGAGVQLASGNNLAQNAGGVLTMTAGSLDLNGNTLTLGANLSTTAGTIAIGTGALAGGSSYNVSVGTGATVTQGTGTLTGVDFTVNGTGTYTCSGASVINAAGNVVITSSSWTPSSSVITMSGSGKTINASQAIYSLNITGTDSINSSNDLILNGAFSLLSGSFSQNSKNLNVAGSFTLALGTAYTKGGTLTFNGTGSLTDSTAALQDLGVVSITANSTRTQATAAKMTSLSIASGSTYDLAGYAFSFMSSTGVANSGNFKLKGKETLTNVSNLGTGAGTVIYYGYNVSENITVKNFGSPDYFNLTIDDENANKATYRLAGALDVNGAFKLQSGTFDANSQNQNYAGSFTLASGTTYTKGGTLTFDGGVTQNYTDSTAALQNIGAVVVTGASTNLGLQTGLTCDSLTIQTNGKLTTNNQTLTIGSSGLSIALTGTLDATGTPAINLSGNWSNAGAFTAGSSTVTFTSINPSTISGPSIFNNLACTTAGKTLNFASGSTQTIQGAFTITGTALSPITLARSGGIGLDQWNIKVLGSSSVSFALVSNSNANGNAITALNSTSLGNNTNWLFLKQFSGTVYRDNGQTPIGPNKTIAIAVNGGAPAATVETGAQGNYTFSNVNISNGDVIIVYIDGEVEKGCTITVVAGDVSGLDIYQGQVIVRHDYTTGYTTNANLAAAHNGSADIPYSVTGNDLTVAAGNQLYVWAGDTYSPGGAIHAATVNCKGILDTSLSDVTLNGNLVLDGTMNAGARTVTIKGNLVTLSGGTLQGTSPQFLVDGYIGTIENPINTALSGTAGFSAKGMRDNISIALAGSGDYSFIEPIPGLVYSQGRLMVSVGQQKLRASLSAGESCLYQPFILPQVMLAPMVMSRPPAFSFMLVMVSMPMPVPAVAQALSAEKQLTPSSVQEYFAGFIPELSLSAQAIPPYFDGVRADFIPAEPHTNPEAFAGIGAFATLSSH